MFPCWWDIGPTGVARLGPAPYLASLGLQAQKTLCPYRFDRDSRSKRDKKSNFFQNYVFRPGFRWFLESILGQRFTDVCQEGVGGERLKENGGRGVGHAMAEECAVRVAGNKQDFDFWASGRELSIERLPIHLGHDHIGEEEVDGTVMFLG